jgi:ABC-type sugar transport system substrate-binding protein
MPNLAFGGGWYGRVSAGFHDALNQSRWAQNNINLVFETITAMSPADEVTAMQAAQTRGANLIGLASLDQNALVPAVVAASQAGASVFTFGLSLNTTLLAAQGGEIITDVELQNYREGVEITSWLVIYLQTHPQFDQPYHIFIHDLSPAASAGYDRLVGAQSVLDPLVASGILDYTIGPFDNDLTVATAYNQMQSYLATSPPLTAVLALQDVIAVGDIKALKEAGLLNNPVIVVGSDCIPMGVDALNAREMTASTVNPGYPIGYWAGQAIVLWARYHNDPSFTPPPKQLFIWQGIATPDDMSLITQTPPLPWTPVPGYTPGDYGSLAIGLSPLVAVQAVPSRRNVG